MNKKKQTKRTLRERRHARVRAKIKGTAERPRLSVFRSLVAFTAQIIDDSTGKTMVSVKKSEVKDVDAGERKGRVAKGYALGRIIAEKAKAAGVTSIVFDRGGYPYSGRVRALAEGARDGGLLF
ncbi:MAG: 50S ribosomal protein L18 [Candidatus Magasanikbacteria bacterium]|jgi:large subunit ribosomal protein L18|nr:50S ribosomal protein L18 [Candidatus Magasanikbacteria bacterium]MBT5262645.1 50S ribosomal protein L18 [Candidatus Magasanikbacteria bacterium]MBT5820266.1 50S ribosomal protein L18 [Candidatus Magasanikbacteria bacterium]MBT6294529.1 50S ribosomal protein L18 [Candidatus Magasanikbacteria bacterium]